MQIRNIFRWLSDSLQKRFPIDDSRLSFPFSFVGSGEELSPFIFTIIDKLKNMQQLKNIIVCDSGLGGLDIAGHFFRQEASQAPEWNVIYFNAYPDRTFGYNDLPTPEAQEELFKKVLMAMERYNPFCCLIACNTLSIVYQRLSSHFQPSFPVYGIVETALQLMESELKAAPESHVLILGTKSTIASQVYQQGLVRRGIEQRRIASMACPKLATLIEQDPAAPEVRQRIAEYAKSAKEIFSEVPKRLFLAFCCTHYGYASRFWKEVFDSHFGDVTLLNPNERLGMPGSAATFQYLSKIDLLPGQREAMGALFRNAGKTKIADGLLEAVNNTNLF